ncbi:MAG TPA: ABC transporter ATP-binding protein [Thermoplasmata archaeon]|nr:ABC transporter ATP-binding protein [Thermoplasmata archaeon]
MAKIEVRGLSKRYGGSPFALTDASFTYEGSGAIGYLGPNGAGKTTTLKLLTGLLRPSGGSALINGVDVQRDRKHALADVGAVIETPEPYPTLTVQEAIQMVSEFRGGPVADFAPLVRDLHEKLDLPPFSARTGRLSKGQRQRVVIAGSLVRDPHVIILDEPTSGLDPKERILIRNLLVDLKRDHLILMSSHLMQEVTEICDQVIFINDGKILLRDSVDRIGELFRTRSVEVEFSSPVLIDKITAIGGLVKGARVVGERRFRIDFDGTTSARAELLQQLVKLGPVISYTSGTLALEDAYLALMGAREPSGASAN